jgi:hypothetical protein
VRAIPAGRGSYRRELPDVREVKEECDDDEDEGGNERGADSVRGAGREDSLPANDRSTLGGGEDCARGGGGGACA